MYKCTNKNTLEACLLVVFACVYTQCTSAQAQVIVRQKAMPISKMYTVLESSEW